MSRGTPVAPATPDTVVAVLSKRGRFLVAEPLFPPTADSARPPDGDGSPRRGRGQIAVDPRAGRAGARANVGDLVLVKAPARGRAQIARVLGRPDVAHDVLEGLMLDRGLRRGFDPAVEHEAAQARDRGRRTLSSGPAAGAGTTPRRDLRELATFTIDPATARDFDDAVSAERLDGGRARVWVHIADVCAHVPVGSLVDREAWRRGTSVYVPGAVEPMMPEALSNDACSLVPGRDRLAVTVELVLRDAVVEKAAFYRSLIRSDGRLDYDRVDRIFAGREAVREPWGAPLEAARAVASALERERAKRGALTLDSAEPEFSFDDQGNVTEIRASVQTESHRLIEHLMIAANEAVARTLAEHRAPCLYRVHERPDPKRVERLVEQLASLGVPTPPLPEPLSPSQAGELLAEISRLADEHVRRAARRRTRGRGSSLEGGTGGRLALTSLVLRSLKQAYYSPTNIGHAGLGSACYCHFTSPIRRYPDIVCHRALLAVVGAGEPEPRAAALAELGTWTSARERQAMTIERDADDVARCFALEQVLFREGWRRAFPGEITGVIGAGAFVAFGELADARQGAPARPDTDADTDAATVPPFEGMVPVRFLRSEDSSGRRGWWELNEQGTVLFEAGSGRALRLGDSIEVRVRRVEPPRGRVDLEPADA